MRVHTNSRKSTKLLKSRIRAKAVSYREARSRRRKRLPAQILKTGIVGAFAIAVDGGAADDEMDATAELKGAVILAVIHTTVVPTVDSRGL